MNPTGSKDETLNPTLVVRHRLSHKSELSFFRLRLTLTPAGSLGGFIYLRSKQLNQRMKAEKCCLTTRTLNYFLQFFARILLVLVVSFGIFITFILRTSIISSNLQYNRTLTSCKQIDNNADGIFFVQQQMFLYNSLNLELATQLDYQVLWHRKHIITRYYGKQRFCFVC